MLNLFVTLMLLSFVALLVGFIRPSWLRLPSRMHVAGIFSTGVVVCIILIALNTASEKSHPVSETASTTPTVASDVVKPATPAKLTTQAQNVPTQPEPAFTNLDPDTRRQEFARVLADELVKRNNVAVLREWAKAHKVSVSDFVSAATLREEIKRATGDFASLRDEYVFQAFFAAVMVGDTEAVKTVLDQFDGRVQ